MAFQDPNAAALAAGAKPGQIVTVGGNTFTVTAPSTSSSSSTSDPNNKKHPDTTIASKYPYAKVTMNPDGSGVYIDHTPDLEHFREFFSGGGYREIGNSPTGGMGREVIASVGKVFQNLADGLSHVVAGHADHHVGGNQRHNVEGDHHEEKGGNHYQATGGHKVTSSSGTQVDHTSDGDKHHITSGNVVTDHSGSIHSNISTDVIEHIGGHKAEFISGGDYGINIQAGNMDTHIDAGKYRMYSVGSALIESKDTITIKVGKNTIVIDTDGITISAASVKFKKV